MANPPVFVLHYVGPEFDLQYAFYLGWEAAISAIAFVRDPARESTSMIFFFLIGQN